MIGILISFLVGSGLLALGAVALAYHLIVDRTDGASFEAGAVPIYYTLEGNGAPVVLLHGFAVNGDLNWRLPGITGTLAAQFTVITPDLRGHGLSGKPHASESYGLELVSDVSRLLDHLDIRKVHLVGCSLGGFIALKFAAIHPGRVLTLSVLAAGWEPPDNSPFRASLQALADKLRSGRAIGPPGEYLSADRPRPSFLHAMTVKIMTGYFNDRLALAALMESLPELALSEQEVRQLQVPICSIVGSRDLMRPSAEALAARAPDVTFTLVEDADHISTIARDETLEALRSCLTRGDAT